MNLSSPDVKSIFGRAMEIASPTARAAYLDEACGIDAGLRAEIEALIKAAVPDAEVIIEDLAGDGDHYAATVVSEAFRGLSRVRQHQIVYAALSGRMGGQLHALALQTSAPEQGVPA